MSVALPVAGAAVVLCGLATGGCTYQLHSLLSKDDSDGDQTGSISRPGEAAGRVADAAPPSEADLSYARAAASDVLARSGKDARDFRFAPLIHDDLSNLPPSLILVAGYDPLRDEGIEYAKRLIEAGNRVLLQTDNQVLRGVDSFPDAKRLSDLVRSTGHVG